MRPGHALLVHGTLPPAHIRTRPYYRDRRLAARASLPPAAHRPAPVAVHLDKRQEVDRHA
jgi:hypothetical protein